jgi:O-antigen ligase
MILPLGWAAIRTDRYRKVVGAILLLSMATLFLTGSLSGIVAAAAAMIYLVGPGRRAVVFGLIFIFLSGGIIAGRPDFTSRLTPVRQRLATWNDTLRGMAEAPIFGHGAGTFERLYMTRYRISAEADEVLHPHSWPIKIGFEQGAVGLAAFILFWSALLSPPRDRSWRAAAIAFGVAMLLDVADHSATLRALGLFALGASLKR